MAHLPYVDGFVTPVRSDNRDAYLAVATISAEIFHDNGALSVVEAWEDDVADGKVTDFHRAVAIVPGEIVVFSWVTWPDKATREAGMAAMMADSRMKNPEMPFDGKRMIFGGFQAVLATGDNAPD